MQRLRIKLITLGNLKYPIDFDAIEGWRSEVFKVTHASTVQGLPDADIERWAYSDELLMGLVERDPEFDITLGLINAPLTLNYYSRRLKNNVGVLSLFETADILKLSNIRPENFILRTIYQLCCYYHERGRELPPNPYTSTHGETRDCLFDMNMNKADIIHSSDRPLICGDCRNRIKESQAPNWLLTTLDKELRRIKKGTYYRLADFIKEHPIFSLLITALTGILLNIVASYLYEKFIKPAVGL